MKLLGDCGLRPKAGSVFCKMPKAGRVLADGDGKFFLNIALKPGPFCFCFDPTQEIVGRNV
jgi:hypothetical protein